MCKQIVKIIFIALSLIVIGNSCKKEICDFHALDPEIRSFLFKPGSYWVYQDSASNRLDTITVTATENVSRSARRNFNLGRGCYINELYDSYFHSSLQQTKGKDYFVKDGIFRQIDATKSIDSYFYLSGANHSSDTLLGLIYRNSLSNNQVNGIYYDLVRVFQILPEGNEIVYVPTTFYSSPKNGIIRFEVDSAVGRRSVWNLISKNVKPF